MGHQVVARAKPIEGDCWWTCDPDCQGLVRLLGNDLCGYYGAVLDINKSEGASWQPMPSSKCIADEKLAQAAAGQAETIEGGEAQTW